MDEINNLIFEGRYFFRSKRRKGDLRVLGIPAVERLAIFFELLNESLAHRLSSLELSQQR